MRLALFGGICIVAWRLEDLGPVGVLYQHSFEKSDYSLIYFRVRRIPAKYNDITKT